MPKGKLSLAAIEKLPPGTTLYDTSLAGFGVRKNARHKASFILKTRAGAKQVWVTIGRLGAPWTIETARKEALRILGEAASGNPLATRSTPASQLPPFSDVIEEFLASHGTKLKPRTREVYATLARLHLKPFFKMFTLDKIEKRHVAKFHAGMVATPRNANHAVAVLSKLISWAGDHGYKVPPKNPCLGIVKYKERSLERYLSVEEVVRLGAVLREAEEGGESPYVVAAIRLLLLTGARLNEMLTLRWDWVDLSRPWIRLPDSKTGPKVIRLGAEAVEVLTNLPRVEGNPFVIVGKVEGCHLVNLQKSWRAIRKKAGLEDVRIHDLRHSFASFGVNNGASLAIIGRILGHTRPQTTARYSHISDHAASEVARQTGTIIGSALAGQRGGGE
jgi:integrase